jgi:hypothetical protein
MGILPMLDGLTQNHGQDARATVGLRRTHLNTCSVTTSKRCALSTANKTFNL